MIAFFQCFGTSHSVKHHLLNSSMRTSVASFPDYFKISTVNLSSSETFPFFITFIAVDTYSFKLLAKCLLYLMGLMCHWFVPVNYAILNKNLLLSLEFALDYEWFFDFLSLKLRFFCYQAWNFLLQSSDFYFLQWFSRLYYN